MKNDQERGALSINLRRGERIEIGDGIEIILSPKNGRGESRLIIVAPKEVRVRRTPLDPTDKRDERAGKL